MPSPATAAPKSAQAQFDAAKHLYEKDMSDFGDAVIKLREANKAQNGMSCSYLNLTVVTLASAQAELKKMIGLIEAAHQDASPYRRDYKEAAGQYALRKASLDRSGCN